MISIVRKGKIMETIKSSVFGRGYEEGREK